MTPGQDKVRAVLDDEVTSDCRIASKTLRINDIGDVPEYDIALQVDYGDEIIHIEPSSRVVITYAIERHDTADRGDSGCKRSKHIIVDVASRHCQVAELEFLSFRDGGNELIHLCLAVQLIVCVCIDNPVFLSDSERSEVLVAVAFYCNDFYSGRGVCRIQTGILEHKLESAVLARSDYEIVG